MTILSRKAPHGTVVTLADFDSHMTRAADVVLVDMGSVIQVLKHPLDTLGFVPLAEDLQTLTERARHEYAINTLAVLPP